MTKHQYYLQLRKDVLEERMRCDTANAMILASLALQAEFGDYQPEVINKYRIDIIKVYHHDICNSISHVMFVNNGDTFPQLHGKTYFRVEHYLPASVLDKLNQSTIKEELSKLHSNYYEASDTEAEFEFLKVKHERVFNKHFSDWRTIICIATQ